MANPSSSPKGYVAMLAMLAVSSVFVLPQARADDSKAATVPRFLVDPYWPKPLPNRWVTGPVGGICIDRNDHVFGINRGGLTALETQVGKIA